MFDSDLVREKVMQSVQILKEKDVDAWLTFVRETSQMQDPCMDLMVGVQVAWHSAFIVTSKDDRIAIVGRFDRENIELTGAYQQVIGYDESIRPPLVDVLNRLKPQCIAINYSENDPAADGLTHGMWATLFRLLEGTPFSACFVSAENVIGALRGRKSPAEIARIKAAIAATDRIFNDLTQILKPGQTELELRDFVRERMTAYQVGPAWELNNCPIYSAGPDSPVGHAAPGPYQTARGQLLQMDFGVKQAGFCSDIQRMWYFLDEGETLAPPDVQRAFDAVRSAILAAAKALKPGAIGWEVDQAARSTLVKAGYPEYAHATGHQLGRTAHDGSTILGPRWERYGQTPFGIVEVGNVFTLELGTRVPGRGYVGLEEDVVVTSHGIEWLTRPQTELILVKS
jgi:Xaa-Pro aminopeptidase